MIKVGVMIGVMVMLVTPVFGQQKCQHVKVNDQGIANADVVVDNTAGGIKVAGANANRCSLYIGNSGSSNPMTCAPVTVTVTVTKGKVLAPGTPGEAIGFDAGQQEWRCISDSGTTAIVIEEVP